MKVLCRSLLLIGAAVVAWLPPGHAQSADQLFFDVRGDAPADALPSSARIVGMHLESLFAGAAGGADQIRLNVGEHDWSARLRRYDPADVNGFRSWVGTIDGIPQSHVVVTERQGIVSGAIHAATEGYQIRTMTPGVYALVSLDVRGPATPASSPPVPTELPVPTDVVVADDGSRIDLMILYTPEAASDAGGASQILALASQIVTDTNTVFQNSGVIPRIRLVATLPLTMQEFGLVHVDLQDIAYDTQSNTLRGQYGADLVHVLLSNTDTQNEGSSWLMSPTLVTQDFAAFSASRVNTVPTLRPTYQIGFSLGSSDAPEDSLNPGYFAYSRAYKSPALGFRTLMADACQAPASCPRILQFSNPAVLYQGNPTGTDTQNNAGSINNVAVTIANLRPEVTGGGGGPTPDPPSGLQSTVSGMDVTLFWDAVGDARTYHLQIGTAPGISDIFDGNVGNIVRFNTSLGLGTFFWRVYSVNPNGRGLPSAEASFAVNTTCAVAGPPRGLSAAVSGDEVFLTWQPPALGTVSTYVVEAGSSTQASNLFNGAVGPQTVLRAFVPTGVYFVRVRAQNPCGSGLPSNEVFFTVGGGGNNGGGGGGLPAAPQDLRAQLTAVDLTVSWNLGPGSLPPTAFILEAGSAPGLADLAVVEIDGRIQSFTAFRPGPGVYYLRVRSRNGTFVGPATGDLVLSVP